MDIVGGLYQELCETPVWCEVFGSGGRAAAALVGISPSIRLHTYVAPGPATTAADALRRAGVQVETFPRATEIVFSYLHPLSNPHLEPPAAQIPQSAPLRVMGGAVLRFGFIEGDAVVEADRAVFDPQTARRFASFRANGSRAKHLALVLNEGELQALARDQDLQVAARKALAEEEAEVLVLKRGVRGALVFEGQADPCPVPAYRSSTVFKIGTGDVFSAWFAHLWAEQGVSAAKAADRASRAVAAYAQSRTLPPPEVDLTALAIGDRPGRVRLEGNPATLGRRFVLEETRYILKQMGLVVDSPGLGGPAMDWVKPDATLVVAEAIEPEGLKRILAEAAGRPVIVLDETRRLRIGVAAGVDLCADFTSAVYRTAWAALQD